MGIYECNDGCECARMRDGHIKCPNRVVQNGIKVRLQAFKTLRSGWGLRSLHYIPKGTFICTYAGRIINDAFMAHYKKCIDKSYLADMDFYEEAHNYAAIRKCVRNQVFRKEQLYRNHLVEHVGPASVSNDDDSQEPSDQNSQESDGNGPNENEDEMFQDALSEFQTNGEFDDESNDDDDDFAKESDPKKHNGNGKKRRRRRYNWGRVKQQKVLLQQQQQEQQQEQQEEEVEEEDQQPEEYHNLTRAEVLREEVPWLVDGSSSSNIGRLFNHSCSPNLFVQSVFVETHDVRFNHIAIFASR